MVQEVIKKYRGILNLYFCQIWLNLPMDDCHFDSLKKIDLRNIASPKLSQ
jgi:hypothetical protein